VKPHLIIKLREPIRRAIPYWEEILRDKTGVATTSTPQLDQFLIDKYQIPYWLTQNFKPEQQHWNNAELKSGLNKVYRLILQRNTPIPDSLIREIRLLPEVEYAKTGLLSLTPIPDERISTAQGLSAKYRTNGIRLQEAHQYTKGHPEIKVAVLDTGFELDHPEIKHALLPGKDFVDIIHGAKQFIGDFLGFDNHPEDGFVGHATHVTGIIAGKGLSMPLGVVPNCKILPVKVLGALKRNGKVVGAGLVDNIDNGLKWAIEQGADIINMSLGIRAPDETPAHKEIIDYALQKGVTVVAAMGNDGTGQKYYPGALPGVIAVGATDDQGRMAPFSTYGSHVSVVAPGVMVYSAFLDDGYTASSGTSQAAPFVSGGIALLKSFARKLGHQITDQQVKYVLKHTSDKISHHFKDRNAGYGRINLLDALKLLKYKLKTQYYG